MELQLENKVVLITGGGKGIGAAIARACAREGAIPVFVDKDEDAANGLKQELSSSGAKCFAISADVVPPESCAAVVDQT
ncbi:MAG TPA: SDR family NAD(P)-dependent oxidoreductase, partial [Candidatus Acidoferrum sp.]